MNMNFLLKHYKQRVSHVPLFCVHVLESLDHVARLKILRDILTRLRSIPTPNSLQDGTKKKVRKCDIGKSEAARVRLCLQGFGS